MIFQKYITVYKKDDDLNSSHILIIERTTQRSITIPYFKSYGNKKGVEHKTFIFTFFRLLSEETYLILGFIIRAFRTS